jgi:DNA polymerase III delta subunit
VKIRSEVFLKSKKNIAFNKILITGSDESLISYVKNFIIEDFKKRNFFIDISNNYNNYSIGNLFSENKTLFVLSDFPINKETTLSELNNQSILVTSPNGKKTNTIKSKLTNDKESLVIECYSLSRSSKENTLKNYIEVNNLTLSNDVFWYLVENFDNNYVIFIKQLEMLSLFNRKIDLISDIEKITFVDNKIEINKIFFNIFKENKILTNAFNKSISSLSDFYIFLNSIKLYLEIIKNSNERESALYNFPKYLFAEKDIFLKIYNKTNKEKLAKIYKSLSRVEFITRQNPRLYLVVGLRFCLNLKKLITS